MKRAENTPPATLEPFDSIWLVELISMWRGSLELAWQLDDVKYRWLRATIANRRFSGLVEKGARRRTSGMGRSRWLRRKYTSSWSQTMPAYLIAEHIITDAERFDEYRRKVAPTIARFGGRYLTKPGTHALPEGGHWAPERVVIIEFADMQALNDWYKSAEYAPLKALRKASTSDLDMMITVDGADSR